MESGEGWMRQKVLLYAAFFLFVFASFVIAEQQATGDAFRPRKTPLTTDSEGRVIIQRLDGPIELDGMSDEPAWEKIQPFDHVKHSPTFGEEIKDRTLSLLAFDNDYLYLAGRLYDRDTSKIQGLTKQRDTSNPSNDFFGILIDCFCDKENALAFFTTPAGLRWDANISNDAERIGLRAPLNLSWNTFWDVAVAQNGEGWFVEMRIPLSSLRFQEKDGRVVMGIITWRWIPHRNEVHTFPAIRPDSGFRPSWKPSRAQEIVFNGIQSRKPLYIAPYVLGGHSRSYSLNSQKTDYEGKDDPVTELGLDVKFGLTSNLTMDLTINTDFAQVEADAIQVNLTRFSLFYPERRLFFLERSSNFEFSFGGQDRLFYSRRIGLYKRDPVPIYVGARLVGRAGGWDLGFLNMQTVAVDGLPSENFGVFRVRRQVFNPFSYVGGMVTSRIGMDGSYNVAYGLDGIFRLFGDDYLTLNWAQTFEDGSPNKALSMDPSRFRVNWERRKTEGLGYNFEVSYAGKDYNPGVGYERRDDFTFFDSSLQYGWLPSEKSWLSEHQIFLYGYAYQRNSDRSIESFRFGPGWSFATKSGYSGTILPLLNKESLTRAFLLSDNAWVPVGEYTFYGLQTYFNTPGGRNVYMNTNFYAGSYYDGWLIRINLTPSWSLSSTWRLSGRYQYSHVEFPDRSQKFVSHIARLRITATFTTKISASALIQYSSAGDVIIANIRIRYNPREGNDFYLVYNHGINTDRQREFPILPYTDNRAILLKYTYTFNVK
jgi:hypothetical protein